MEEHIRALLQCFQYSEQCKETAAFRVVFGGETLRQVATDLAVHNRCALRNRVSLYQRKVQTGLFVPAAMTRTQKRDVQALQQRNDELEQALQQANLLILALNTMIDVAEQERQVPSRKKLAPNSPEASGKRNCPGERRSLVSTVWGKPTSFLAPPAQCPADARPFPTRAGLGARAAARDSGPWYAQIIFADARAPGGERHQNGARQTASALANARLDSAPEAAGTENDEFSA
ncbi:MAG: hypothetical protein ACRYG7_20040 [Janthinobacterium lividum]